MVNAGIWQKTVGTTKIAGTIKTMEDENLNGTASLKVNAIIVVRLGIRKQTVGTNFQRKNQRNLRREIWRKSELYFVVVLESPLRAVRRTLNTLIGWGIRVLRGT